MYKRPAVRPQTLTEHVGLALALTRARPLKSSLYGVRASDPVTFTFIAFSVLMIGRTSIFKL